VLWFHVRSTHRSSHHHHHHQGNPTQSLKAPKTPQPHLDTDEQGVALLAVPRAPRRQRVLQLGDQLVAVVRDHAVVVVAGRQQQRGVLPRAGGGGSHVVERGVRVDVGKVLRLVRVSVV